MVCIQEAINLLTLLPNLSKNVGVSRSSENSQGIGCADDLGVGSLFKQQVSHKRAKYPIQITYHLLGHCGEQTPDKQYVKRLCNSLWAKYSTVKQQRKIMRVSLLLTTLKLMAT